MEWHDEGVILGQRPCQEHGLIMTLLTHHHGLERGYLRRARKGLSHHMGDHVRARWRARLAEQLGFWTLEPFQSYAGFLMMHAHRIGLLQVAASLMVRTLPLGHPYPQLYQTVSSMIQSWAGPLSPEHLVRSYVSFEKTFLAHSGYGLDEMPNEPISCSELEGHSQRITQRLNRHVWGSASTPAQDLRQTLLSSLFQTLKEEDPPR